MFPCPQPVLSNTVLGTSRVTYANRKFSSCGIAIYIADLHAANYSEILSNVKQYFSNANTSHSVLQKNSKPKYHLLLTRINKDVIVVNEQ